MIIYVYTLSDPNTLEVKYVGITSNPKRRYKDHLKDKSNNKKVSWIKSLRNNDRKPVIDIIEECDSSNWVNREIYWIKHYRDIGCDLKNLCDGGVGSYGYKHTDEWKKQASIKRKGNLNSFYNKSHSDEVKEMLSKMASERIGVKNHMYGKIQRESSKRIISEKKIGIYDGINNPRAKKLYQYNINNDLIKIWDYSKECADEYNISSGNISTFAKHNTKVDETNEGKYRILKGFVFKFQ